MTVSPENFRLTSLRARFGDRHLVAGHKLVQSGKVKRCGREADGTLNLEVGGEDFETVRVREEGDAVTVTCSCRATRRCAHRAAAMLELSARPEPDMGGGESLGEVVPWQVALHRAMAGSDIGPAPDTGAALIYRLEVDDDGEPLIETRETRIGQDGPRRGTPFGISKSWGADPLEPRPPFLTREDVAICRQLREHIDASATRATRQGSVYCFQPPLEARYGLLTKLIRSGKLYAADSSRPLSPGPACTVTARIDRDDDGGWRVSLGGVDLPVQAGPVKVIAAEPPLYTDGGTVGSLVTPLPGKLATRLALNPLHVSEKEWPEFVAHWMPRLSAMGEFSLPPELSPEEVVGTDPVPRLILGDEGGWLRLGVEFVYGEAAPVSPVAMARPMAFQDGRMLSYRRNREMEAEHLQRLLSPRGDGVVAPSSGAAGAWALTGDAGYDFLLFELPLLSQEGWQIYGEEHLARHRMFRGEAGLSCRVKSGIDWFDLAVLADFDGIEVGAAELLKAHEAGKRYVELSDGRIGRIPDWVRQRADSLAEAGLDRGDSARLSRYQVPLLMELTGGGQTVADDRFREAALRLKDFERIEPVEPPKGLCTTMRPYQLEGLAWLEFLRRYDLHGILADDMGLGKTLQMVAMLLLEKQRGHQTGPSLVVMPTTLIFNWVHELKQHAPDLGVTVWHGPDRHGLADRIKDSDVVLTNYALVRQDLARLEGIPFHYLVLDEAQYVKNPESQVSRAVRALTANHRVALTGTPLENHLGELWSQFAYLMPGLLGTYPQFRRRFGGPIERGDTEAVQRLIDRVRPFILRRTKDQVAQELPERVETILYCRMEEDQRALYDRIRDRCRDQVADSIRSKGLSRSRIAILDALLKLRQVCCHSELLPADLSGGVTASAKMDLFVEFITEAMEEEHRVLVFSQFVSMLKLIRRHLDDAGVPYAYLDGRTRNREKRVKEFQEDPAIPVFLISLKAGGTGLNLTAADYVVHFDPWWNPAVEQQATDRAHRIGQTRKVFSYKMIAEDTVEEKIVLLQEKKQQLSNILLSGEKELVSDLTMDDIEKIFGHLGL
ncbi:MAG: SNF2-related protein [Leptospirillia bacterium]